MKHDEFRIGIEFGCGGRRWRCTDIGTRTVIAICLDPHEVVSVTRGVGAGDMTTTRMITADDSWFAGPPYAVAEDVFDEYSIEGCSLSSDAVDE